MAVNMISYFLLVFWRRLFIDYIGLAVGVGSEGWVRICLFICWLFLLILVDLFRSSKQLT